MKEWIDESNLQSVFCIFVSLGFHLGGKAPASCVRGDLSPEFCGTLMLCGKIYCSELQIS